MVEMEFRELLFEVGTTWLPNFLSRSTRRVLVEMEFRELLFQAVLSTAWKTWRKDNVQRPKIDPHVMKG